MRELVFTCAIAVLGSGCVQVVSHVDEYDAGPDVKPSDGSGEPETGPVGACMSGMFWTGGNKSSAVMSPGRPCMANGCHSPTSTVPMTLGGTLYTNQSQHDVDDCNGVEASTGYAVAILDDTGMDIGFPKLFLNSVGNFYTSKALPASYKVKVIKGGVDTPMMGTLSQTDGNCNSCHTADGIKMAKGRIFAN